MIKKSNKTSITTGIFAIISSLFSPYIGLILLIIGFVYSTQKQPKYAAAIIINSIAISTSILSFGMIIMKEMLHQYFLLV